MGRKKSKNDKFEQLKLFSGSEGQSLDFSQICKFIREIFQVSQADMARKLNVELRSYRHWEYGERQPSSSLAVSLYVMFLEAKEEASKQQALKEQLPNNQDSPIQNQAA
jgi:DNA-binding transcriptional regulator YiaG